MIGRFHLGFLYDMSIWQSSQHSPIYPCQYDPTPPTGTSPPHSPSRGAAASKTPRLIDLFTVLSDSMVLYLQPHPRMKNVSKLMGWFSLSAIEQVRRNLDSPDSVTFVWRDHSDGSKHPLREFKMVM